MLIFLDERRWDDFLGSLAAQAVDNQGPASLTAVAKVTNNHSKKEISKAYGSTNTIQIQS